MLSLLIFKFLDKISMYIINQGNSQSFQEFGSMLSQGS